MSRAEQVYMPMLPQYHCTCQSHNLHILVLEICFETYQVHKVCTCMEFQWAYMVPGIDPANNMPWDCKWAVPLASLKAVLLAAQKAVQKAVQKASPKAVQWAE